jgi:hypothetical protein
MWIGNRACGLAVQGGRFIRHQRGMRRARTRGRRAGRSVCTLSFLPGALDGMNVELGPIGGKCGVRDGSRDVGSLSANRNRRAWRDPVVRNGLTGEGGLSRAGPLPAKQSVHRRVVLVVVVSGGAEAVIMNKVPARLP